MFGAGRPNRADAIQLASDLIERVRATPLFVDAYEHDGIIAGVEQLPQFLAAALMSASCAAPGWREAKRLAGRQFAEATDLSHSAQQLFDALLSNRDNLLYRIEQIQREMDQWVQFLTAEPEAEGKHPLLAALETVVAEREQWEVQTIVKKWEESPQTAQPAAADSTGILRQMFLGNLMGRRPDRNDKR